MKIARSIAAAGWLVLAAAGLARGQNNAPTTVQLPTFSFFTVSTTVSVPDSGGAYLGGISRGRTSSTSRGLPLWAKSPWFSPLGASRGAASELSRGGMSVHATIIDHRELDEAVLAAASRAGPSTATADARSSADAGAESVAAIRRQLAEEDRQRAAEIADLVVKAEEMAQAKKPALARMYYKMAARRAEGSQRQEIEARLAALPR
jgi:hypothetical protein